MGPVIFFDGVCNFCNYWVSFIIKRDKRRHYKFAPLQGQTATEIIKLTRGRLPDTVILYEDGKLYYKSSAALRIAKKLNGGWKMFYALIIIPKFLRDPVYNLVAKNRYKWFGKKEECMIPSPDVRDRFLP